MNVVLRTDGPTRTWHRRLGELLAAEGHALAIERTTARSRLPATLRLTLAVERILYGVASHMLEPASNGRFQNDRHAVPLATKDGEAASLVLEPRFDGVAGEAALVAALLVRRAPRVEIHEIRDDGSRLLAAGLPAVERADVLASALDMVLARTIQLVSKAARNVGQEAPPAAPTLSDASRVLSPPAFLARSLAAKVALRSATPRGARPNWRIAVSREERPRAVPEQDWNADHFVLLPNDGSSFHADPFPFTHQGRTCLFFEDFPYATRKGVIAMVEIGATGVLSSPRIVLERPEHLSYPLVLAHGDDVYMVPEMSQARQVRLFRADPFPDRWVPDRILIEEMVLGDATLVVHEGRWWMFATQSGDGGSSWDALCLFHAPDLFGPWTPHAENPVLIDAGAARPAGAMWHAEGALMRVAQDCRGNYGAGVAICRVDRLDPSGYAQTCVGRLEPPAELGADRVHTLNRLGDLQTIDIHRSR